MEESEDTNLVINEEISKMEKGASNSGLLKSTSERKINQQSL
jgi:hypothetical protein